MDFFEKHTSTGYKFFLICRLAIDLVDIRVNFFTEHSEIFERNIIETLLAQHTQKQLSEIFGESKTIFRHKSAVREILFEKSEFSI